MGRIRTKDIKNIVNKLIKERKFKNDFVSNKKILEELNIGESKKNRNRIAGYITRVMRR
ncbi:MAG: 30S ribosomal protein S17e [Candidatus Aenigmatarchaeota archaeon]